MKPLLYFALALSFSSLLSRHAAAEDERPTAMKLLPAETVLLLRTADAALLGERLAAGTGGKMLSDPEMVGLVSAAEEELTAAYDEQLRDVLGADLEDLRQLPSGELAFAIVERPGRSPAFAAIADFGERADLANEVIDRLYETARENGRTVVEEPLRNDTATLVRRDNNQNRVVAVVHRESAFVIATDRELLQSMLDRWDGVTSSPVDEANPDEDGKSTSVFTTPLADNAAFAASLRECLPGREEPPQLIFYINPIGMLRATVGQRTPVRLAMATFPALGLNGIQGAAVAMWFATDKWDSLIRGHLLLDNPRAGVLKIARFEPGDPTPPNLVPAGIENLVVLHADPQRMLSEIERLVDRFRYEGSLQEMMDANISESLGIDFREEFLANLAGHAYVLTSFDEGQTDSNRRVALAVRLRDTDQATQALAKIADTFPQRIESASRGTTEYFTIDKPSNAEPTPQRPTPAYGLIGDCFVIASSDQLFAKCSEAHAGVIDRHVNTLTYRLVAGRLKRLAGGAQPSITHFNDPSVTLRHWHSILSESSSREWLDRAAERNPVLRALRNTLDQEPLPPIETLLKYNSPGGTVVYDTPTGFHLISFGFKR